MNRTQFACFALLLVSGAASAAEEEALPPIRVFSIETIESLAAAMYAQDRLAWVATDVAIADRGEAQMRSDGARGWITIEGAEQDIVRFIRLGDNGPEALYDIFFVEGQEPQLFAPATPVLTEEELAQYNARMLGIDSITLRCSETVNTIALKEPGSDNWLVWVMASTTAPDTVVVGGHTRFTISPDGTEIIQADRLARGCLELGPAEGQLPEGVEEMEAFRSASHVVSLTPVETHLFANLYHPSFRYVGTMDGTAWKMEEGRMSIVADDAPGADGASARYMAGIGEYCSYVLTDPGETPQRFYVAGEGQGKVILETENAETYAPPRFEDGMQLLTLVCGRLDIVPSPNDHKIIKAGYSLMIMDNGEGHPQRTGTLEMTDGTLSFTLDDDSAPLTPELQARMDARLTHFREMLAQP